MGARLVQSQEQGLGVEVVVGKVVVLIVVEMSVVEAEVAVAVFYDCLSGSGISIGASCVGSGGGCECSTAGNGGGGCGAIDHYLITTQTQSPSVRVVVPEVCFLSAFTDFMDLWPVILFCLTHFVFVQVFGCCFFSLPFPMAGFPLHCRDSAG